MVYLTMLKLTWINPPQGIEPEDYELNIPVISCTKISDCLIKIYVKTGELAKITVCSCDFDPKSVQLICNDTLLTSDEYNTSVKYFTNGRVKLGFNTLHCGTLIVRVMDFDPKGSPRPLCALALDYAKDTLETMVQSILKERQTQAGVSKIPMYIFTESKFLIHPGMTSLEKTISEIPVRGRIGQCEEIYVKDTIENDSEIGVTVTITMEKLLEKSFTIFLDSSMSIEKVKMALELKSGILRREQRLTCDGVRLEDQKQMIFYDHLKNGSVVILERIPSTTFYDYSFADLAKEVENIPNGMRKFEKPSKGLNIQGICINEECKNCIEKIKVVVPWPHSTFDLALDSKKVNCPGCMTPMKIQSPLFHLTQWKFYGRKFLGRTESEAEYLEGELGVDVDHSTLLTSKLLTCEWQITEDPESSSGFNVIDLPEMTFGLADWKALLILTQPSAKKKERTEKLDFLKFGFGFSLPGIFGINFDFDRFKAFD